MPTVHGSRSSSRRRARSLEEMADSIPKNTATICLDGTDFNKILQSYVVAMKDLDNWIRAGTKVVDASFYGQGLDVARTRKGIFIMVYELEGNSLSVPIEGLNLYLRGFQNEHGNFGFNFEDPEVIQDKTCKILDIGVNYYDLLDDRLERTLTGVWPLRKAVRALCEYKGGPAAALAPHVGTIAIHTSEAARTTAMHSFICRSIVDLNLSRLDKEKGLKIWIRKYRPLSFELMDNIDRIHRGKEPRPIKNFGLNITLLDLIVGIRVCYIKAYTQGVFAIKSPVKGHEGSRGKGGGQGLVPHKIQKRLFTTSSMEKGYTLTSSSYGVRCALSQIVQRETFDREKPSYGVKCSLSPMERPSGQKGSIRTSYSISCDLNQTVQRATFDRAKPFYGVNWSLGLMKRRSGPKGSIRTSYSVNCALSQIVQRATFDRAKPSSEINHSCVFRITSTNSRAQVITTKRRNLRTCVDLSIQRSILGPSRIYEKTDNRRLYSSIRSSINLLPSNLSSSFPQQNVRWYLYRALRLLH